MITVHDTYGTARTGALGDFECSGSEKEPSRTGLLAVKVSRSWTGCLL
jgi:hypothetical protein